MKAVSLLLKRLLFLSFLYLKLALTPAEQLNTDTKNMSVRSRFYAQYRSSPNIIIT